jgi:hypothetical protein
MIPGRSSVIRRVWSGLCRGLKEAVFKLSRDVV